MMEFVDDALSFRNGSLPSNAMPNQDESIDT
jgi:hypothetical protein